MSRKNKSHITARNQELQRMYEKLASIKEDGVQKYSDDFIMIRLRKRFHLENKTIRKIIKGYK